MPAPKPAAPPPPPRQHNLRSNCPQNQQAAPRLCRGAAPSGVYPARPGLQLKARIGHYMGLGRGAPGEDAGINRTIPHNSKCRYGERGAADAKPKAQIILCVLSSILATQMPCRTPSRSEALRSATDALRRLLARRSAGAMLKPSGGNCAVLP